MLRQRESKSAPVGVVVKVLRILDTLHAAPSGLQLKEIARLTGINKSTAYRFLAHLESEGYLFRDDAGAYVIGPKLARLGSGINYEETLRKISRPVLHKLWQITGETTNLAILEGHEVLYLDVIESSHTFRLASQVGARRPLYCTSLGKAIAAYERGVAYGESRFDRYAQVDEAHGGSARTRRFELCAVGFFQRRAAEYQRLILDQRVIDQAGERR